MLLGWKTTGAAARPSAEEEADGVKMLRVEEVAQAIGTTPDTIRRWLRDGKLRGVRPGGTKMGWRIPESEVERVLTGGGEQAEGKARAA